MDGWATRRVWIGGACGAILAGTQRILDFWSLGAGRSFGLALRGIFDLSRVLLVLPLAGFVIGLLIACAIALWRRHFRRMASSVFAIAAIPVCFVAVARVSVFDPWLWYAMANRTRFEALAERDPISNGLRYAAIETRDVSTGFVGVSPNHFIVLIYDESDAVGLDPSQTPDRLADQKHVARGQLGTHPQGQEIVRPFFPGGRFRIAPGQA